MGLEVSYMENGLFLIQAKYVHDVLTRVGLLDSKHALTRLSTSNYLVTYGSPCLDPTLYRSLVGALQYLTVSCPDISCAVSQVIQFLHAPTIDHFKQSKES